MMKKLLTVLTVFLVLGSGPLLATATLESFKFADDAAEQHFKDLIAELRCLVCQNQSLADSDAELAHDLRAEVYEMVQEGKSDEEIIEFLVSRYGDFVLYKPPMKPSTYLLWFGPFALMILAGVLLLRAVQRQKRNASVEISTADRKRLDDLLGTRDEGEQKS
jgi:cytochrome c-type biogenesis protein CcmH